ncbi:uncharacterized protein [Drosophila kikkawai]|uniref:Uncharacterized protein isoform X2 n=1 Tax=Drosophila kikkawai TaxID=30033 RepID=A0ABM4GGI6_DROKI
MNPSRNLTDLPLEVHPHIGLAFAFHNSKRLQKLKIAYLNVKELSVVLQLCGSSVNHIDGSIVLCDELKLVEQHCPNLQFIELVVSNENLNGIKSLLTKVRSLISMTLNTTPIWHRLGIVELLKLQPSLRRLHLRRFCGEELFEVRNLVNLEELIIDYSLDESFNIHVLCYRLKKLRTLHVQCLSFTVSKEFGKVACPALTELKLCNPGFGWQAWRTSARDMLRWILSHAETLEVLHLSLRIPYYEPDTDTCEILSECKRLRHFYMPIRTGNFDFAHRLIEIVSEKGKPLELDFDNNMVHDQIRKLMDKTAAKHLITLGDHYYF